MCIGWPWYSRAETFAGLGLGFPTTISMSYQQLCADIFMQFSQTDSTSFCFRQTSTGPMLYGLLCALCTILLISVNCLLATHWLGTNAKSEAARPSLKKVRGLRPDAPPPSESDEYAHLHSSPNRLWRCVHTTGCTTGCKVKICVSLAHIAARYSFIARSRFRFEV